MKSLHLPILSDINPLPIIMIAGAAVLLIAAVIIIIFLITHRKNKKSLDSSVWLIALGNKENVKEVTATGSRLSVVLENKEIIDREKLKELGVSSVLVMSNKVTLVIEGKAEQIAASIQKDL